MRSIAYCAALAAAAGLLAADGALGANPGPTFVDPAGDAAGAPAVTPVRLPAGAPDGSQPEWRFSPAATVRSIAASFTPAAPAHGRLFVVARVRTVFSDGTTGTAPVACTARLRRLPLSGSCRWRIPADASGKTLSIVVRAAG